MSDADEADAEETERDVPNRVRSLHATIEKAIEQAEETNSWRRDFSSSEVAAFEHSDLPSRTLRRAMKDAEALGWIEKKRQKWVPGERAEEHADEPEPEPSGHLARNGPDEDWHLLSGHHTDPLCDAEIDRFGNDEHEHIHVEHDDREDVDLQDVCADCLGF